MFTALVRPQVNGADTAISQIRELGFDPHDVRHIITTHLDLDHAGGLPDFPDAEVHLLGRELRGGDAPRAGASARATSPRTGRTARTGCTHAAGGEQWHGFDSVRILPGSDAEILLIPLLGHTHGHTGVAIRQGDGWLLHCGDAYFHHGEVATPPHCPPGIARVRGASTRSTAPPGAATSSVCASSPLRHSDEVELICSHDATYLDERVTQRLG